MPELYQGSQIFPRGPDIDLWLLSTETTDPTTLDALQKALSPAEQTQLQHRRRPQSQRQFLLGRGCLRHLLGRYTGGAPASLTFVYGPRGKPALGQVDDGNHTMPQFNLSHSGQRLLVAISVAPRVRAIGVDIEMLRSVSYLPGMCDRCLTAAEAATVLALDQPQADHRFLRYWTGKEACLKALGVGITDSMQSLELTLGTGELTSSPTAVALTAAHLPVHPGQLYQWQPEAGYVGAIAVQTVDLTQPRFSIYQITPDDLLIGAVPERL